MHFKCIAFGMLYRFAMQLGCRFYISNFLFELGMKEFEGIKDANVLLGAPNQAFASLIPFDSFIPNSNEKLLVLYRFTT
jgi:hypothetical protein